MSMGSLCVLLGEVLVQVLCPFFNWVVCLPGVESNSIYILAIKLLFKVSFTNIFSHTVGSLFILLMVSLAMQQLFYFGEAPFVYSFLYVPCSRGHIAAWNI